MNRWRQRLAELHGEHTEQPAAVCDVQNVQNDQKPVLDLASEQFEQVEQPMEPRRGPATTGDRALATWDEREEERAAIVEHDGAIPRVWAEGFAHLYPDRPPSDVPLRRWQQFVDDVGRFLDGPFCTAAAALGWGSFDLFGCDHDKPFARIDRAGLLWLLNGGRLVMLTDNGATIETQTGVRQTLRCRPAEPGRVLAWELMR
jgi:hypothetical protein